MFLYLTTIRLTPPAFSPKNIQKPNPNSRDLNILMARQRKTTKASMSMNEKKSEEVPKQLNRGRKRKSHEVATSEPEFFQEKRRLEDLWQAAFPIGTEWDNMDKLSEINWDFSNLEKAFEESGPLHGKTVYLFGSTEPQLLNINGQNKVTLIPIVVAVDSPVPPSDKIGIKSVQRETEDIIPMKAMKMAWIPYIPVENRLLQIELLQKKKLKSDEKTQIYTLGCTQRRSALQNLKIERIKQFDYCLPYLQPLKPDEDESDTVVNIMYPIEPPVVCDFDWELDELEEFVDDLIKDERLAQDQKDAFKDFVKQQVREKRKAQREAKEARENAIRNMDEKTRSALENMKVYKFYPVSTPDTPDISSVKVSYINRYYGKAHEVL